MITVDGSPNPGEQFGESCSGEPRCGEPNCGGLTGGKAKPEAYSTPSFAAVATPSAVPAPAAI